MKILSLLAGLVIAFAACASPSEGRRGAAGTPGPGASPTTPAAQRSSTPSPGATSGVNTFDVRPSPTGSPVHYERKATVSPGCIRSGRAEDSVTLTIRAAPNASVGYSTAYSDGSNELTNRTYTTGFGAGAANAAGIFTASWVVPATAPLGKATVHPISAEGAITGNLSFTIVATNGSCS